MRVKNINPKRDNRTAVVITDKELVLYDAYEGRNLIARNMVRPREKFWAEHAIIA